jgi:MFS transporter, DHA1 family, multidrug resistance protein
VHETSVPSGSVRVRTLLADYRQLLTSARFVGLSLGGGCATTSLYAFISATPFILTRELHQPVQLVGLYAGIMVSGVAIGNALTGRLAHRVAPARLLRAGNTLSLASAAILLAIVLAGDLTLVNAIVFVWLFNCGCGLTSPAALAQAVSVNPRLVGSAAGLYGCTQMTIGAICTALAAVGPDPALTALSVMVVATAVSQVAFAMAASRQPA